MSTTATHPTRTAVPHVTSRALTACGVVAGPLFATAVVVQALARDGFDPLGTRAAVPRS